MKGALAAVLAMGSLSLLLSLVDPNVPPLPASTLAAWMPPAAVNQAWLQMARFDAEAAQRVSGIIFRPKDIHRALAHVDARDPREIVLAEEFRDDPALMNAYLTRLGMSRATVLRHELAHVRQMTDDPTLRNWQRMSLELDQMQRDADAAEKAMLEADESGWVVGPCYFVGCQEWATK